MSLWGVTGAIKKGLGKSKYIREQEVWKRYVLHNSKTGGPSPARGSWDWRDIVQVQLQFPARLME